MSWPDAAIVVSFLAFFAFGVWQIARGEECADQCRVVAAGEQLYAALDVYYSAEYPCDNEGQIEDALTVWQEARRR